MTTTIAVQAVDKRRRISCIEAVVVGWRIRHVTGFVEGKRACVAIM
jgi:hypothetical protein